MTQSRSPLNTTIDPKSRALTWLRDHGSPRLVMSLMLASTVGCGFLASVMLHRAGMGAPLWRYPLAVLAAWAVFLGLVSVWVWWQRRANALAEKDETASGVQQRKSSNGTDWTGGIGLGNSGSAGGRGGSRWGGGGGRFGGAGASDSFAEAPVQGFASGLTAGSVSSGASGSSGSKGGGWDLDFDGDDMGFVVMLIGVIVVTSAVFGVAFYAVYSAPTFFAELLIDGGVGTWLYKRADVANRPDWLTTAVRRSVWPVVIVLLLFVALALLMQRVAPGATTLGQAWHAVSASQ